MTSKFNISILLLLPISVWMALSSFSPEDHEQPTPFTTGEKLEYRVHYGMITAADAIMEISDEIVQINNKPCYKIDVKGTSTGIFDFFIRIRDNWGTYFDTSDLIPQRFYRHIEEGRYRKHEIIDFDHQAQKAVVSKLHKHTQKLERKVEFDIPRQCQDLVSGYYFLRNMDFSKMTVGEIIALKGFFDDQIFDFKVRFKGRDEIKTKYGKTRSLMFVPIMPENSLFDGEDSIKLWLTDDKNKIPVKVKAEMFVGSVEIDIKSAKNLKYPLDAVVQ